MMALRLNLRRRPTQAQGTSPASAAAVSTSSLTRSNCAASFTVRISGKSLTPYPSAPTSESCPGICAGAVTVPAGLPGLTRYTRSGKW